MGPSARLLDDEAVTGQPVRMLVAFMIGQCTPEQRTPEHSTRDADNQVDLPADVSAFYDRCRSFG